MFEKIFGKKKSIQRSLIINMLITIAVILIASIIGLYVLIDNQIVEKLIQININSDEEIREILNIIRRAIVILILNTTVISIIFMRTASKKLVQPIEKITVATKEVASGNFAVQLETTREDEIGELTTNFNEMVKDLGSIEFLQKEFIDNVSHEIKTPITSIQGFADLLDDDTLTPEERKEYIGIIKEEANRLLNLSNNTLKLSKLQNQTKITSNEQFDVSEQIRKSILLLKPKWKEKEITFNVSIEEKYFYGDEDLTFQIWVNLIENAIKFSKQQGTIDIILKEENDFIVVKIKDYGIGMSEEEQKKIFDRFYQIDKSHSGVGSGLGLAIVKRIIELSNGTIEVESKEGKGTTMLIKLPLEKETKKIHIK